MDIKKKRGSTVLLPVLLIFILFAGGCAAQSLTDTFGISVLEGGHDEAACVSSDRYAHHTLTEDQQRVYDEMLDAIMNMKESVRLSTSDRSDVRRCYNAICADYGEIFWVDHWAYREITLFGSPVALSFDVTYAYSPEEVAAYRAQMQPVIDEYLEQLGACGSDYEKTEVLYNKLINDVAPYVAIGRILTKIVNGVRKYKVEYLCKVKFKEPDFDETTKGESVEFKTNSIEGVVLTTPTGDWSQSKTLDTYAEAETYLNGLLTSA